MKKPPATVAESLGQESERRSVSRPSLLYRGLVIMRRNGMAGSKKMNLRRRPPPITAEPIEMGTDDVSDLNKGIVFCLKQRGGKPCPKLEQRLLEHAKKRRTLSVCLTYARKIRLGRWPELEPLLLVPHGGYDDFMQMVNFKEYLRMVPAPRRHPVIERELLSNELLDPEIRARGSYLYAKLARQRRWKPGERVILQMTTQADNGFHSIPSIAEAYRKRFFPRENWPELNRMILAGECSPYFSVDYCSLSPKKRVNDVAAGLLKSPPAADGLDEQVVRFARDFIGGKWEAGEKLIGTRPYLLCEYAKDVIEDVLPDNLHQIMAMRSFEEPVDDSVKEYFDFIARKVAEKEADQPAGTEPG